VWQTTRKVHNLKTTTYFSESIGYDLAVLLGNDLGELTLFGIQQLTETKHDCAALREGSISPGRKGSASCRYSGIDVTLIGEGNLFGLNALSRVKDLTASCAIASKFTA
jgi:hypothetical protein